MTTSHLSPISISRALLIALPPVIASVIVLSIAGVSASVWTMHAMAIAVSLAIAVAGPRLHRDARADIPAVTVITLTIAAVAVTLIFPSSGPSRWMVLGPVHLYMAPMVLPSFLAALSIALPARTALAFAAAIVTAALLAAQPDASQVLALVGGAVVVFARERARARTAALTVAVMTLVVAWAFTRPDPLLPVPWVEGVFALALGHSAIAGVVVIACAVAFITSLALASRRGPRWLSGVAAYYAVLFACSIAGLTPAPLIGFGAGPLLGFGLLAATAGSARAITER
ncbi:MAG: hypothetical protein WCQ64_00565 [Acidobacteriota bacterium]